MAKPSTERVEPTADEKRNGWSAESLSAYLQQRESERLDYAKLSADAGHKVRIATSQTTREFNPHNWMTGD